MVKNSDTEINALRTAIQVLYLESSESTDKAQLLPPLSTEAAEETGVMLVLPHFAQSYFAQSHLLTITPNPLGEMGLGEMGGHRNVTARQSFCTFWR